MCRGRKRFEWLEMEPGSRPPHYLERPGRRVGYEERERGVGDLVVRGGTNREQ